MTSLYINLMTEAEFDRIFERDFSMMKETGEDEPTVDPLFGHAFMDNIDLQDEFNAQDIEDEVTWGIFEDAISVNKRERYEDWASWTAIRTNMECNFLAQIGYCKTEKALYALKERIIRDYKALDEAAHFVRETDISRLKDAWKRQLWNVQRKAALEAEKARKKADEPCAWRLGNKLIVVPPSRAGKLIELGFQRVQ